MNQSLQIVTAPVEEPLSIEELRDHLRITDDAEDELLTAYLIAVRQHVEQIAGVALLQQTLELGLDAFPWISPAHMPHNYFAAIKVPRPPLQSVAFVKYVDQNGTLQTLASNQYLVDVRSWPGQISPAYGITWPCTRWQPNAVIVQYVCGYPDPASVPEDLKQALRVAAGMLYEYREQMVDGAFVDTGLLQRLLGSRRAYVTA